MFIAIDGKLHVSALIGHLQVFFQINLGSKNIYVMRVYLHQRVGTRALHKYFWIIG
jgi:hypothetical protein